MQGVGAGVVDIWVGWYLLLWPGLLKQLMKSCRQAQLDRLFRSKPLQA